MVSVVSDRRLPFVSNTLRRVDRHRRDSSKVGGSHPSEQLDDDAGRGRVLADLKSFGHQSMISMPFWAPQQFQQRTLSGIPMQSQERRSPLPQLVHS